MKKNVFLSILVAVVLSTGLFAEGKKPGFVDLGVSYHFFGETGLVETPSGNKESILAQNSFSIDFSVKGFSNEERKVGVGTVVNLFFPQSMNTIIDGYEPIKLTASDFDSAYGLSLLVGPAIKAVQKDNFVFLITPGITYALLFFDAEESTMTTLFGIGSEFSANFLLAKHFYLKLNIDFRYYLLANPNGNGFARENGVSIQPGIAAGFYF